MVHVFGSGHSRIMVEEMWPRYGSFPGFNPIVELSLTFHNLVVGANGQRQAMFLENVSGLAERILRNFDLEPQDSALVVSSSGCNIVPIEMAEGFQQSRRQGRRDRQPRARRGEQPSRHADGKKLHGFRRPRARHRRARRRRDGARSTDWTRRSRPARPSAGACWSTRSRPKSPQRLTAAGAAAEGADRRAVVGAERATALFEVRLRRARAPPGEAVRERGPAQDFAFDLPTMKEQSPAHDRHRQLSVSRLARIRLRSTSNEFGQRRRRAKSRTTR